MWWHILTFLSFWLNPPEGTLGTWTQQDFRAGFVRLYGAPLARRVEFWSRAFLGTPYRADPLGEGPGSGPDPDPFIDYRRVDCLTFVQTVMALSFAEAPEDVAWYLRILRYVDGRVTFSHRYYTMAKGWYLGMQNLGLLEDVTELVGRGKTRYAVLDLSKRTSWSTRDRERFALLGTLAPRGLARMAYVGLDEIARSRASLPEVSLLQIVREPSPESPYLVSHVGFLLRTEERLIFRHASRSPQRRHVEDRSLSEYVSEVAAFYQKRGERKFLGFNVGRLRMPRLHATFLLRRILRHPAQARLGPWPPVRPGFAR